jgi:4-hydroxyphenylpyruvate dioxygenase-like putative hemolysin
VEKVTKPIFTDVLQVGMVVKDLDEAVKNYADGYGIGPWKFYTFDSRTVSNMSIREQKTDYAMRLAVCDIGNVQWELIQPTDDKTLYAEFLKKHGPGLHHCAFGIENYDEFMKIMRAKGKMVVQEGNWLGFTYTYMGTEDELNVISEVYNVSPGWEWPEPEKIYEAPKTVKPVFTNVLQVGMVVKDLDQAVKNYADKYGIGPWKYYTFDSTTVSNMSIREKKTDYAMRLAVCDIGNVQWELIQPTDDKTLYAEFLKEHGPGLHHCAFDIENYEEVMKTMRSKGKMVVQEGTWFGMTYTYAGNEDDLNLITEFYNIAPEFEWPEPESVYPPDK